MAFRYLPPLSHTSTAAGTTTTSAPIIGRLEGMHVAFHVTAGTLVVSTVGTGSVPTHTVLTLASAGTAWYWPRVQGCGNTGSAISGVYDAIPLHDYVQMVVNSDGTATVTLAVNDWA